MRATVLGLLLLSACGLVDEGTSGADLTSVDGAQYTIDFDAFVDVGHGASDDDAKAAIHRQVKSALGALREQNIGVADRDAQRNIATMALTRASYGSTDRVRYHYRDTALVEHGSEPHGPIDLTMLYGDYVANAGALIPICSDDQTTDGDSLWYHYQPHLAACAAAITSEQTAIDAERATLAPSTLGAKDLARRFLGVRATLVPVAGAPLESPEHDQLWGFSGDPSRTKIVVYAFFGVNADESKASDDGLVEYLRFQRTLRAKLPSLGVTETSPQAFLLDFYIGGQKLPNVTWDDVEHWVIDGTNFPAAVGTDATKRAQLLAQVVAAFSERWIVWSTRLTAKQGTAARTMTLEIRTWHGWEDGSADIRLHARWRYLEAFWNADVFAYTGHSHFGHGPLEPWEYSGANFPDRYQVMLFNSCLSFNYYDEDFLAMHPEGSKQLDVVVNGLPAYWVGMGQASAGFVTSLVGGTATWPQVLKNMVVDLPWQRGYDPMRAVNGELDNSFTGALTVGP